MRDDVGRGRSFDGSSPVLAYWLANSEGFQVRSGRRRGVVEEVVSGTDGNALQLHVRFGGGRPVVIAAEEVERVVPVEELLVLRSVEQPPRPARPSRLAPAVGRAAVLGSRGTRAVGRGSRRAGASSWRAIGRGARDGWAGLQYAEAETRRATQRGACAAWRWTRRASIVSWSAAQRLDRWLAPHVGRAGRLLAGAGRAAAIWIVATVTAAGEWLGANLPRAGRAVAARSSARAAEARAWLADRDRAPARAGTDASDDGSEPEPPQPEPRPKARGKNRQAA